MSDEGNGLKESELLALSKDCKFVRKKINKGLVKYKERKFFVFEKTNFLRNDFLVALLSRTDCYYGYSSEQIISIFGDAVKRYYREDSSRFLMEYNFIIEKKTFDKMKIEFKDDKLESFKIRRAKINVDY
jgi:hypothetical protein